MQTVWSYFFQQGRTGATYSSFPWDLTLCYGIQTQKTSRRPPVFSREIFARHK